MYQSANLRMKVYEMQVKAAAQNGETIHYVVTPIYGSKPYPDAIHMFAEGSNGFKLNVRIENTP
jgi:hypothetical protein